MISEYFIERYTHHLKFNGPLSSLEDLPKQEEHTQQ